MTTASWLCLSSISQPEKSRDLAEHVLNFFIFCGLLLFLQVRLYKAILSLDQDLFRSLYSQQIKKKRSCTSNVVTERVFQISD